MKALDRLAFQANKYEELTLPEAIRELQTGDVVLLHGLEA